MRRALGLMIRFLSAERGSEIVEFAVSLPLLMVILVGITDFGSAITLKHKLNNAVREGARLGSIQPMADLYSSLPSNQAPPSVNAIARLVGQYLAGAKVNDCGLASGAWSVQAAATGLAWTYTTTGTGCPGSVTLVVDRDHAVALGTGGSSPDWLITTQVSIQYPYRWTFNKVITVLQGGTAAGPSQLTSEALVPNLS